jgi:2-oxo-4-hydroxy-4-carboxy--5-ureidoimidazoline (OHCU) decarboxylase
MNRERQQLKQTQDQLATANQQLAEVARDQEELAQLKKQTKEATAELHREQQSIELEKVSGQQQLTDARAFPSGCKSNHPQTI